MQRALLGCVADTRKLTKMVFQNSVHLSINKICPAYNMSIMNDYTHTHRKSKYKFEMLFNTFLLLARKMQFRILAEMLSALSDSRNDHFFTQF